MSLDTNNTPHEMPPEGQDIEPTAIADFLRLLTNPNVSPSLFTARINDVLRHGFPYAQNLLVEQEKRLEQSEENQQRIIKEKHARVYPPGSLRSTGISTALMRSYWKSCRKPHKSPDCLIRHLLLEAIIRRETFYEVKDVPFLCTETNLMNVHPDEILKIYRRCIKEFIRKKWVEQVS